MGTRDEILQALAKNLEGMTSKELAPLCPACECDELVVGRTIAQLRAENLIHSGTGFRAGGGTVWIYGPAPGAAAEPRVSLESPKQEPSAAAKAIAAMRQTSAAKPPAPAPASTPKQPAPQREGADMTIREKVEALLKEQGPMDSRTMRKHGLKGATLSQHLSYLADMKVLKRLGGGRGTTIFGLPGQTLADAKTKPEPERQPMPDKAKYQAPSAPRPANGSARFAIDEAGELAIEVDGSGAVRLAADAFARLRDFINRTKPIWEAA